MSLFSRKTTNAATYVYCEPVSATALSVQHLRLVGDEGYKFGGGIPTPALCGRDLRHGWDLPGDVTPDTVRADSTPHRDDGRVVLCSGCASMFAAQTTPPLSDQ